MRPWCKLCLIFRDDVDDLVNHFWVDTGTLIYSVNVAFV